MLLRTCLFAAFSFPPCALWVVGSWVWPLVGGVHFNGDWRGTYDNPPPDRPSEGFTRTGAEGRRGVFRYPADGSCFGQEVGHNMAAGVW